MISRQRPCFEALTNNYWKIIQKLLQNIVKMEKRENKATQYG